MQIIINGVGGQGVLFLSKILCSVALSKGYKIQSSETIGMAQRGGSVISFLKIGDKYTSPMVIPGTGDFLLCLHEQELLNGKQYLKEDGFVFINSDSFFNATKLALNEKMPNMTNIIFLGYLAGYDKFPFNKDDIEKYIPRNSEHCFILGYNAVLK